LSYKREFVVTYNDNYISS